MGDDERRQTDDSDAIDPTVTVWVGGDGGSWSCSPARFFRVPTEVFDYSMLMGRLNSPEDLEELIEQTLTDQKAYKQFTDIWVSHGGSWSGAPSIQYEIPGDIFAYLLAKDMQNTIGELTCPEDLKRLIDESRKGALFKRSKYTASGKDFQPMVEMKGCGHLCTASSVKEVCYGNKFNKITFSLPPFLLSFFLWFFSFQFVPGLLRVFGSKTNAGGGHIPPLCGRQGLG